MPVNGSSVEKCISDIVNIYQLIYYYEKILSNPKIHYFGTTMSTQTTIGTNECINYTAQYGASGHFMAELCTVTKHLVKTVVFTWKLLLSYRLQGTYIRSSACWNNANVNFE